MPHYNPTGTHDTAPHDQHGTPDEHLERCECGTIHRTNEDFHATVCPLQDND